MIEKLYNAPQKKPILQFRTGTLTKEEICQMHIDILKHEIATGNALYREIGNKWYEGEKLDEDDLKGRRYQLSQREKELEQLLPLPF